MPRRDGTGPRGMGATTGRGRDVCTGVNAPVYRGGCKRGLSRNKGLGLGANADNYNQSTSKEALQAQAKRTVGKHARCY